MCDCIGKFNEHLKEFNTKIEVPLWTASGILSPFIQTIKINDKARGKPKSVMASHCPFCGEKYATASTAAGEGMSAQIVTDEMVLAGAKALFKRDVEEDVCDGKWDDNEAIHERILKDARACLTAALD